MTGPGASSLSEIQPIILTILSSGSSFSVAKAREYPIGLCRRFSRFRVHSLLIQRDIGDSDWVHAQLSCAFDPNEVDNLLPWHVPTRHHTHGNPNWREPSARPRAPTVSHPSVVVQNNIFCTTRIYLLS